MKNLYCNFLKKSLAFAALSLFSLSMIAGNPNFSGTWTLNKAKSTLSSDYSFSPTKMTISQDDQNLNVERVINLQGTDITVVEKMTLDGAECINSGYQGNKKYSTANWDENKNSLIVKNKIGEGDGDLRSTLVYSLEGENLKVESIYTSSYGDLKETWMFDKAD